MENSSGIPHITCEHLQKIKTEGGAEHEVVDLRDPVEFDAGHIEGSFNVPRRELKTNIENLVPHRSHKVIVVVGPTHQAEIEYIYEELKELGYEQVEFLAGGFDRWCEISLPSVDDVLSEMTPEEMGRGTGGVEEDAYEGLDPEEDNEPLM
ncbi:rhodanese-like domain-containing protein [Patescibacteria group bacterium]|nr:rhodanese-like domain-containing protein [Patescibacteria group bacterium]MBU1028980.1 rhodanese-like domain-containing protein [Patescibacteria group bacterium]MBU1915935.1 rhodanese-like domain-containing protein [Patescibacteria group bacterium]